MSPPNTKRSAAHMASQSSADGRAKKKSCHAPPALHQAKGRTARKCAVCNQVGQIRNRGSAKTFLCPNCLNRNKIGEDGNGVAARRRATTPSVKIEPGSGGTLSDEGSRRAGRTLLTIMPSTEDDGLLELYERGHGADVTIITADGVFRVHKAFLADRSPFFYRALARSAGAESLSFYVKEKALIMDAILRHIYRLPLVLNSIGHSGTLSYGDLLETAHNVLVNLVALRNAALKYHLPELMEISEHNFYLGPLESAPARLTDLGGKVFERTDSVPMRKAVVSASAACIKEIVNDDNAWYNLSSNEEYSRDVFKLAVQK